MTSGEVCGAPLDPRLRHLGYCDSGYVRLRAHKALAAAVKQCLRRAGAFVDLERYVPELLRTKPGGTPAEAILNVVAA